MSRFDILTVNLPNNDPLIGRFISADTLVPHPTNPQSFNRYSYVLNNPLKYIDPSGHIVNIGGVNVGNAYYAASIGNYSWFFCQAGAQKMIASQAFQAYDVVRGIDPVMTQGLETSKKIVNIVSGQTGDASGSCLPTNIPKALGQAILGKGNSIDWTITLDPNISSSNLAPLLGHELYHADDPLLSDSIEEELRAYQYGDRISTSAGLSYNSGFGGFDPNTLTGLYGAALKMLDKRMPEFYRTLPLHSVKSGYEDFQWAIREGLNVDNCPSLYIVGPVSLNDWYDWR